MIGRLFGLSPEIYGEQQRTSALAEGIKLAQLTPGQAGAAMTYSGARGLGNAIAGAMGVQDPQMKKMSTRNQLLQQLDLTDVNSLVSTAKQAASLGDAEFAVGLIDRAKAMQESSSKISLQQSQILKNLQPPKGTGEERYIELLRTVENKIRSGETPTLSELSSANMAGQIMAKPRSYTDPASGQLTTVQGTDPSKAFPLTYKEMSRLTPESVSTAPKVDVQQVTQGNLPAGSQKEIGDIDASLKKLELSTPELQSFLTSLKSGDVTYNATANTFDFLGATVLPAIGMKEKGDQVKKDEIKRALTERVNSLLLMAKGTQTEGDATRAADQIASTTTYLSQARMIGAIEGLMRAESRLASELGAKKASLQTQGKPAVTTEQPAQEVKQPPASAPKKAEVKSTELSREQKIQLFIKHNGDKPTRQEAIDELRRAGKL